MNTMRDEALAALRRGWSVIPISRADKKACVRWIPYQKQRPAEEVVGKWFTRYPDANLAVVLGPVSGNLWCRDFDMAQAWEVCCQQHPELAERLLVAKTARGFHAYFHGPKKRLPTKFADGELRGEGHYAVIPPSIHATGVLYEWVQFPEDGPPEADPALFARSFWEPECETETSETSETTETVETMETAKDSQGHNGWAYKPFDGLGMPTSRDEAIAASLPTGHGQRHHCLFRLCRPLKAMPEFASADGLDLWNEFSAWFQRAEPHIRTKDETESWHDFVEGWDHVQYPAGQDLMDDIVARARQLEPLAELRYLNNEALDLLAAVCAVLQDRAGDRPFYLSVRKAGEIIGKDASTAWRYLDILRRHGRIHIAERGTSGKNGRATRYRYTRGADNKTGQPQTPGSNTSSASRRKGE